MRVIIAAAGHRPNKLGEEYDGIGPVSDGIRAWMHGIIERYRPEGVISGMALGVDTLWAEVALHDKIKVTAAIPCRNQTARWPSESVNRYARILANPLVTPILISSEDYTDGCMQRRNEWMVDHADLLIAVYNFSRGGTSNALAYARKVGKPVEIFDLRKIA